MNAVHSAIPNDVLYIDVVADKCFYIVINIYNANETVALLSEIV